MKLTIIFSIFILSSLVCQSQTSREIHSIDIIKVAQENGKDVGTARIFINRYGEVNRTGFEKREIKVNTFTKSISELLEKEQNAIKVDGDNDKRPGFQEPYNGQHVFITVIYQDDFDNEKTLKNKTCYRYRETNLPNDLKEFSFYKYFNKSDLEILKTFLK